MVTDVPIAGLPRFPFSPHAFLAGVGGIAVLCGLVAGITIIKGPETIAARESKLASQTVVIDYVDDNTAPPQPAAREPADQASVIDPSTDTPPMEPPAAADNAGETTLPPTPAVTAQDIAIDETTGALPEAPIDGLYEDVNAGRLPVIRAADKMTPFHAYRRPFTGGTGVPLISIVVMDMGLSESLTRNVIDSLPPQITLAVDPYANNPDFWIREARKDGHEAWMKLPVETSLYPLDDPGPQTLLVSGLERQNINKLEWALSRGTGYAGIVTGADPAFLKATNAMRPVLSNIYLRGLGFVSGDTTDIDPLHSIAAGMNGPYGHNNVWIDTPATDERVAASLRQLEILAQGGGPAIGFMHATPMTITMLQSWAGTLAEKGIALAPLSAQTAPRGE